LAISRGAYLAAGVAIVVLAIIQAKYVFRLRIILPVVISLFIVIGGSYLALLKSEPRALDEFISHVRVEDRDVGESVVMRLNASKEAQELFSDRPIFGIGLGNFGPAVKGYPAEEPAEGWPIVNNEYLELLAENGVVSFAAFVILIVVLYARAIIAYIRCRDELTKSLILGLMLALFAILIQYLTFSTLYIIHVWFTIALIAAASNIVLSKPPEEKI
jgi:O-antigen ligase